MTNHQSSESYHEFQLNFQSIMQSKELLPIVVKTARHVNERGFLTVGDFFNYASDLEVSQLAELSKRLPEETAAFTSVSDLFSSNAIAQIFTLAMVLRHAEGDPVMDYDRIWIGAELLSQYLIIEDIIRKSNDINKEAILDARKKYTLIDYLSK